MAAAADLQLAYDRLAAQLAELAVSVKPNNESEEGIRWSQYKTDLLMQMQLIQQQIVAANRLASGPYTSVAQGVV